MMTREQVLTFSKMHPAITLPQQITLHEAVVVVDVPQYIATAVSRLDSPCARLRGLAEESLFTVLSCLQKG